MEIRQKSSQWKSPSPPCLNTAWQVRFGVKCMLTDYSDVNAVVHHRPIPHTHANAHASSLSLSHARACTRTHTAEQIAILKALEQLQGLEAPTCGKVATYTDSRVAIDSLKNHAMHGFLIEKIRNKIRQLSTQNWTIHFRWVKAHIGIEGNEAADRLAKEAAQDEENQSIVFDRIPLTSIASEINRRGLNNGSDSGTAWRKEPCVDLSSLDWSRG